jgi:hypothetical protein
MHSEHDRKTFLLQEKLPRADTVLGLEQPSTAALLHVV